VFAAVLAAMVALNGGATSPPALSAGGASADGASAAGASRGPAGGDIGRASGEPLADAQAAVRAAPASASAYASLGDAYLERARETGDPGFYSRADRALDAALRRDPRSLAALVGAGTLAGLRHDFSDQLRLGREARSVAPELARPLTVIADAQIELGLYTAARRTVQHLVDLKPSLPAYARASYYRELHGDLDGAVEAMRFAVSAGGSPESSAYVEALLGDLELAIGQKRAASADLAAARVQHGLLGKNGTLPDAEAVLFEANHGSPRRAISLGQGVWHAAPSIRSADALGWALTRAGRPSAGLVWARRALRTGSRDPLFRLHAGVAARRAGRVREAERYLTTAMKGEAALSPASIQLLEEASR
jgi:tetratricopeptide (TPR) repeat protein